MNPVALFVPPAVVPGLTGVVEEPPALANRRCAPQAGNASMSQLLRALQSTGLAASTLDLARGALHKMAAASSILASADELEGGLAALLAAQAKQNDQRLELAKTRVHGKFDALRLKNLAERRHIEKRVEAARASGLWNKLINFFKAIGAAIAAASSIFTGPAGIAASALLVTSIIVSAAKPDGWGQWVSLGLSLAALVVGGFAGAANVASVAGRVTLAVGKGLNASCQLAAAEFTIAKGLNDRDGLLAEAALVELRAMKKQLLADADEDRDEMKTIIEAQDRCVKVVLKSLQSQQLAAMAAMAVSRR